MKQMKEQDLFEDLRDDSVLEYLHDYQENTAYPALLSELNALLRKELARITCIDDVMTPLISERTRELECLLKHYRLAGTEYEYYYTGE